MKLDVQTHFLQGIHIIFIRTYPKNLNGIK